MHRKNAASGVGWRRLDQDTRSLRLPRLHVFCVALLLIAVSTPIAAMAAQGPRVRKSYSNTSLSERQDFIDAVLALKAVDPGANTAPLDGYDDFVKLHRDSALHRVSGFLAWHREFILAFEDALRSVNGGQFSNVTIPYWDWTVESFPSDLDTAGDNGFLGGDGVSPNWDVQAGPFAFNNGWTVNIEPFNGPELKRRLGNNIGALPSAGNVTSALAVSIFDSAPWNISSSASTSFRNYLEGWVPALGLHNIVHVWVGGGSGNGNMYYTDSSPNDLVFFMHHAQVDRIWCQWQEDHEFAFHHLPLGGPGCFPANGPAPVGNNACDTMPGFADRPVDYLNVKGLGYEYDDCVGPCEYGAGSGFDGLTLSQVMILHNL